MELTAEQEQALVAALNAVRASGAVNMMDRRGVADVAELAGYEDEAELLRDRGMRRLYMGLLGKVGRDAG